MNWFGVITAVIGIGVSAVGTYMARKAEEEKGEEMKELMQVEAEYRRKQREMETLSKQKSLEKATRARKATMANLLYNRGFSAEAIQDPYQRLETELASASTRLEESASLAGQIDDITLAQAELDATPADSGLASLLTTTGGGALTATGAALTEYDSAERAAKRSQGKSYTPSPHHISFP